MNKIYNIDLTLTPTTLDLWHVYLLATVFILAMLLIIVLIAMVIGMAKRNRQKLAVKQEPAQNLAKTEAAPEPEVKIVEKIVQAPAPEPVVLKEATPDAALQLLALLQKEARFIDFIKEDITAYNDADVGVAARVVHEGCKKAVNEYFTLATVRKENEGSKITLAKGFDAAEVRLTGNIVGEPPFTGTLIHKGWKVTDIRLPKLTKNHNAKILAAAEVEL